MLPETRGWLNTLRFGLLMSAIGWGISFCFTFASWSVAVEQLYNMGANAIWYQPLLDYWLKMASSVFGCIGIASALACIWPRTFEGLILLLAPFHLFVGVTLTVAAIRNGLSPRFHPTFIPDITFCFLAALFIGVPLIQAWRVKRTASAQSQPSANDGAGL